MTTVAQPTYKLNTLVEVTWLDITSSPNDALKDAHLTQRTTCGYFVGYRTARHGGKNFTFLITRGTLDVDADAECGWDTYPIGVIVDIVPAKPQERMDGNNAQASDKKGSRKKRPSKQTKAVRTKTSSGSKAS